MQVSDFLAKLSGVKQTRYGNPDWMAICPSHADRNPSLHVSVSREGNILLNCFAGCRAEDILERLGIESSELFSRDGPSFFIAPPKREYVKPEPIAASALSAAAQDWLLSREIEPGFAESLGILGDDEAIIFPFTLNGELINVKRRFLDRKDFTLQSGGQLAFFGIDDAVQEIDRGEQTLVICEGEIDWLSIKTAGYRAVLSVPNGASGSPDNYFESALGIIDRVQRVIIATDADEPGRKLARELIRRIGPEVCATITWPEGCNDANQVHVELGLDILQKTLADATLLPVEGIISPDDLSSNFEYLYQHGLERGISCGYHNFDRYYSVVPQSITVLTGVPGSGKSAFLDSILVKMAQMHKWKFAMFTPENVPHEEHLSRWAANIIGKPFFGPDRMSWEEALHAKNLTNRHLRFLSPDEPHLDKILELARVEVRRFGINALIIDPWNELTDPEALTMRDDRYLTQALRKIRKFAEQHNIHVFIVIHPHAIQVDKDTKQYPPVDMYDLHGGAMWSNKTGAMLSIWRDNQDAGMPVKVFIKKTRTLRIGKRGRVNFWYDKRTHRYTETGDHEEGG
jgi:twinkle protein